MLAPQQSGTRQSAVVCGLGGFGDLLAASHATTNTISSGPWRNVVDLSTT